MSKMKKHATSIAEQYRQEEKKVNDSILLHLSEQHHTFGTPSEEARKTPINEESVNEARRFIQSQ